MSLSLTAFLAAAFACLLVSLTAMVLALREPGLALKPLWMVLAFVGVGGAVTVWSTPEEVYWFFGIALPTVSFSTGDGSWKPVLIRSLFPVGALLVLGRLYWHRRSGSGGCHPA